MSPTLSRNLAWRLLAYEAAGGRNSEPTESAAFRVCEKLRRPVGALVGVPGFRSLLSRALTLARAEAPSLSAVRVAADGSLEGLDELGRQMDKDQVREGGRSSSHCPVARAASQVHWRNDDVAAGDI